VAGKRVDGNAFHVGRCDQWPTGHAFDSLQLPSDSLLTRSKDPIGHAQKYIQNHLDRPLSIDVVARWVACRGVSVRF